MTAGTVKISNVSLRASVQDIEEFFSFSGDIVYVEMQSGDDESSQVAYVTFKDPQGSETALLLTGAKIVDRTIHVTPAMDYQLPATALIPPSNDDGEAAGGIGSAVEKAENVVSTMLAKGFILGKDALDKARTFDEKHQLTSTATAKVSDLDKKMKLSEKISMGTAAVNEKVMEMDQKYQVSEKTRSAIAAAEQKVSTAGAAIMRHRYAFTGAAWVTGAFHRVARAASDVGSKAMDKVAVEQEARAAAATDVVGSKPMEMVVTEQEAGAASDVVGSKPMEMVVTEQEAGAASDVVGSKAMDKTMTDQEQHKVEDGVAMVHAAEATSKDSPTKHHGKPEPAQGLIL